MSVDVKPSRPDHPRVTIIDIPDVRWRSVCRQAALAVISLCVGAVASFSIFAFGFLAFPNQPDLPFQIVLVLWAINVAVIVWLWIDRQINPKQES